MLKKYLRILTIIYLSIYFSSCINTRPPKPSYSTARALETRVYNSNYNALLKKSVNILQNMNYTVDVLNSDIGIISASRTTESKQANLDDERTEDVKPNIVEIVVSIVIFSIIIGSFVYMIETIFNGDRDIDEDHKKEKIHKHNNNHYFTNDHDSGIIIYRYKVTINLNQLQNKKTEVRVSASGETERNGKIISTGGIHEPRFFQKFFTQFDQKTL